MLSYRSKTYRQRRDGSRIDQRRFLCRFHAETYGMVERNGRWWWKLSEPWPIRMLIPRR